jgi:hypothetical protein
MQSAWIAPRRSGVRVPLAPFEVPGSSALPRPSHDRRPDVLRLVTFWSTSRAATRRVGESAETRSKEHGDGTRSRPSPHSGRARHLPAVERHVRRLLALCRQAVLSDGRGRPRRRTARAAGSDRGDQAWNGAGCPRAFASRPSPADGLSASRRRFERASGTSARSRRIATTSSATCCPPSRAVGSARSKSMTSPSRCTRCGARPCSAKTSANSLATLESVMRFARRHVGSLQTRSSSSSVTSVPARRRRRQRVLGRAEIERLLAACPPRDRLMIATVLYSGASPSSPSSSEARASPATTACAGAPTPRASCSCGQRAHQRHGRRAGRDGRA